jgi:hypothetical protein
MKVTRKFLDALGVILEEFGNCDLQPRLDYLRHEAGESEPEYLEIADTLEAAFDLVEKWHAAAINSKLVK